MLYPSLPGFENVKRYMDNQRHMVVAKILPGEFYVTKRQELIATVLGSCISACIYDERMAIGGMNHFMLPIKKGEHHDIWLGDASYSCRYGNWAMEHLINEIIKNGGNRSNLKAKVFGGGKIISSMTDVGEGNISFALEYLQDEGIDLVAQDVGGPWPRKVYFDASTGKVKVKRLQSMHNDTIQRRERQYLQSIATEEQTGDIELF